MDNNSNGQSGGVGVLGLLGVSFVILKLTNQIDWSWWYVTSPFWGGLALFVVALALYLLVLYIFDLSDYIKSKKDKAKKEDEKQTFQQRVNAVQSAAKKASDMIKETKKEEIRNRFKSKLN